MENREMTTIQKSLVEIISGLQEFRSLKMCKRVLWGTSINLSQIYHIPSFLQILEKKKLNDVCSLLFSTHKYLEASNQNNEIYLTQRQT